MTWKRFTTLAFSLFLLVPLEQWVTACGGDYDPYDYYTSFFANNINPDPAYSPFRYTEYLPYYDNWYDYNEEGNEEMLPDANIEEWYNYCGKAAPKADIDSFVYQYAYKDLSNLYYHIEKGNPLQVPGVMQRNGFTKWFLQQKDLEALGYLMHAKKCEPLAAISYNSWEPVQRDTVGSARLIKSGLQLHKAAKKEFFQWRYAYQVIRATFYSGRYQQTLQLFNELVGDKTAANVMYPRILSLKAGALYKTGKDAEAAYLYSRTFDLSNESLEGTHISYEWSSDSVSSNDILRYCKNEHEKAVVYIMDGLYRHQDEDEGLQLLQNAYKADPSIRGLDIVMTREINSLEQNFMTDDLTRSYKGKSPNWYWGQGFMPVNEERNKQWDKIRSDMYAHIDGLNAFAQKVATEGKNGRKSYWWLVSSYLYFMKHDASKSEQYLAKAEKESLTPNEKSVAEVIRMLYILRADGKVTAATEEKMLPRLKALQARSKGKDRYATRTFVNFMSTALAQTYFAQQDDIKAVYVLALASNNQVSTEFGDWSGAVLEGMGPEGIEKVKAFYNKPSNTGFEKWLTDGSPYNTERLNELEATQYLRRQEFARAAELLKNVPQKMLDENRLPDPFLAQLRDEQELNDADTARWYDKRSFAQRMTELEAKLKKSPADAQAAFDYGTGLYNMSYYGKAHNAYTYYRSSVDGNAYYKDDKLGTDEKEYYGVYKAEQYFLKANEAFSDPEQKAKCLFMAAKCWQKRCTSSSGESAWSRYGDEEYYKYSLANPYFGQMREQYVTTKFFQKSVASCSYLRDYLRKKK